MIGNLKFIGMDGGSTSETAMLAISFFALGNAFGRLAWGGLFDRYGFPLIPFSLLFLGVALALLLVLRCVPAAFPLGAFRVWFYPESTEQGVFHHGDSETRRGIKVICGYLEPIVIWKISSRLQ